MSAVIPVTNICLLLATVVMSRNDSKVNADFNKWDVFDGQKSSFMRSLTLVYAISDAQSALAVTESDDVFIIGNRFVENPTMITNLCQQKVKAFAYSPSRRLFNHLLRHFAALTDSGKLFTWENNYYGQLGNGSTGNWTPTPTPTLVAGELAGCIG